MTSRKEPNNIVAIAVSVMAIALPMVVGACSVLGIPSGPCKDAAREWGPEFRVAASFATTVGRVRDVLPTSTGIIPAQNRTPPRRSSATWTVSFRRLRLR